ncbi:hypothetical protein EBZ80_15740 [bacterium]|nr:hypothetical protein [bacterium]
MAAGFSFDGGDAASTARTRGCGERDGKDVLHEFLAELAEPLAGLVGVLVRILVPQLLDLPDLIRHRAEVVVVLFFIQGDGLLAKALEREEVLDAAVVAPLAVVRQVILQEDALLADLSEVEAAVEHRQEVFLILRFFRPEPFFTDVPAERPGPARERVGIVAVAFHRKTVFPRLEHRVFTIHRRKPERRLWLVVLAVVEAKPVRVVIIHEPTGSRVGQRDTGKFLIVGGGVGLSHGQERLVHDIFAAVVFFFFRTKKREPDLLNEPAGSLPKNGLVPRSAATENGSPTRRGQETGLQRRDQEAPR